MQSMETIGQRTGVFGVIAAFAKVEFAPLVSMTQSNPFVRRIEKKNSARLCCLRYPMRSMFRPHYIMFGGWKRI